jgi:hypothetical protein
VTGDLEAVRHSSEQIHENRNQQIELIRIVAVAVLVAAPVAGCNSHPPQSSSPNRYIHLSGATKSVNRDLEAKTRALAGLLGQPAEFVIDAYHQVWRIERACACPSTTYRPDRLPPQA